ETGETSRIQRAFRVRARPDGGALARNRRAAGAGRPPQPRSSNRAEAGTGARNNCRVPARGSRRRAHKRKGARSRRGRKGAARRKRVAAGFRAACAKRDRWVSMAGSTTQSRRGIARSPQQARALLRDALVQSAERLGWSQAALARWLRRRPSTVRRWFDCDHRIDVEAVLASPRLAPEFTRCLYILERRSRRGQRNHGRG